MGRGGRVRDVLDLGARRAAIDDANRKSVGFCRRDEAEGRVDGERGAQAQQAVRLGEALETSLDALCRYVVSKEQGSCASDVYRSVQGLCI